MSNKEVTLYFVNSSFDEVKIEKCQAIARQRTYLFTSGSSPANGYRRSIPLDEGHVTPDAAIDAFVQKRRGGIACAKATIARAERLIAEAEALLEKES